MSTILVNRELLINKLKTKRKEIITQHAKDVIKYEKDLITKRGLAKKLLLEKVQNDDIEIDYYGATVRVTSEKVKIRNSQKPNAIVNTGTIDQQIKVLELSTEENIKLTDNSNYLMYI